AAVVEAAAGVVVAVVVGDAAGDAGRIGTAGAQVAVADERSAVSPGELHAGTARVGAAGHGVAAFRRTGGASRLDTESAIAAARLIAAFGARGGRALRSRRYPGVGLGASRRRAGAIG